MTPKELIKSYITFYHVTKKDNKESILSRGLEPNKYPDNDYHEDCPEKRAQICLTIKEKLDEIYCSIRDQEPEKEYIVFEIPSEIISNLDCGLDWTFSGTKFYSKMNFTEALRNSIEILGTLSCFETIPKEHLMINETYISESIIMTTTQKTK